MTDAAPLESAPLTAEALRRVAGRFATGVTVVATAGNGTVHGMTANAFTTVSLDPLLVLVSVDHRAGMHGLLLQTGVFAVSVLSAEQEQASRWFASPRRGTGPGQFSDVACAAAPATGSPVLRGALAWYDCRVDAAHDAGDHTLFIGRVEALNTLEDADALLFLDGAYRRLPR